MNEHTRISDLLPLYVSGELDDDQHLAVERTCPAALSARQTWRCGSPWPGKSTRPRRL